MLYYLTIFNFEFLEKKFFYFSITMGIDKYINIFDKRKAKLAFVTFKGNL